MKEVLICTGKSYFGFPPRVGAEQWLGALVLEEAEGVIACKVIVSDDEWSEYRYLQGLARRMACSVVRPQKSS